ncbi:MAG: DUF6516 family protein [Chloroflexota bacterium]
MGCIPGGNQQRLIDDPYVTHYRILRYRVAGDSFFIRAQVIFQDAGTLHFSEYGEYDANGVYEVITYSFHWMDSSNTLRWRWDKAPHYPKLAGYPHHVHSGSDENNPVPGEPMNLFKVLDRIAEEIHE